MTLAVAALAMRAAAIRSRRMGFSFFKFHAVKPIHE
jgi:hypothetical protein